MKIKRFYQILKKLLLSTTSIPDLCKIRAFYTLSLLGLIVLLITIYDVTRHVSTHTKLIGWFHFNRSTFGEQIVSGIPAHNEYFECFKSPFVICWPYNDLYEWRPKKLFDVSPPSTNSKDPVIITTLLEKDIVHRSFRTFDFQQCPVPCAFTSRHNLSAAKAVMVDGRIAQETDFPKKRYKGQIYIAVVYESPLHVLGSMLLKNSKYKDQINLLSSYRVASDIPAFYGYICLNDAQKKTRQELRQMFDSKSRTAVWFVSNCESQSQRMLYVKELQKYLDVDIYGECGNDSYKTRGTERELLTSTYKFYLSFENSFCVDYVTEKFFKLFHPSVYIVPVVRGAANYEKYFPPNTFINVRGFHSPAELAGYLEDVGGDFEQYATFLWSRDKYMKCPYEFTVTKRMCALCTLLTSGGGSLTSRYKDIGRMVSNDSCHEPQDLPIPPDKYIP